MVKAVVNGKKQVISLDIDPSLLKTDDKQIVQDLVIAAINKAMDEADVLQKRSCEKVQREYCQTFLDWILATLCDESTCRSYP